MSLGPDFYAATALLDAVGSDFTTPPYMASATAADESADQRRAEDDSVSSQQRQFGSSHMGLSPDAKELAIALDRYKLAFCRRYITCEEILAVIMQLGYRRVEQS